MSFITTTTINDYCVHPHSNVAATDRFAQPCVSTSVFQTLSLRGLNSTHAFLLSIELSIQAHGRPRSPRLYVHSPTVWHARTLHNNNTAVLLMVVLIHTARQRPYERARQGKAGKQAGGGAHEQYVDGSKRQKRIEHCSSK